MIRFPGVSGAGRQARERVITMPRARRLASTVVVAALAVAGLAACDRAPDVAVYYGTTKAITEDTVQRVWDDSFAKLVPNAAGKKVMPVSRQDIVGRMVELDALRQLGKTQGFTATPTSAPEIAQQLSMAQDAPLVTIEAEFQGWATAAQQAVKADELTDADLRDIFARLKASGPLDGNPTYEQFAGSVTAQAKQALGPALGLRNDLQAAATSLKIKFNPRYAAPTLSLYQTTGSDGNPLTLVEVTFGSSAAAPAPVTDVA